MKLIKLSSSNPKFKTIKFKPGMNIVAGLQSSTSSKDSYNGIGKSSTLQLVHLMLGGKFDKKYPSDKTLELFLSNYGDFQLDLTIGSNPYSIRVNFNDGIYYINDKKIGKCDTFRKNLEKECLITNKKDISFKQILNCFARRYQPSRNYYTDALQQQGRLAEDFYQRITNISLLGLETKLPNKFKKVKDKLDAIDKTKKTLINANLNLNEGELRDLEDKLELLIKNKENFIIAKNYDTLKLDADILTDEMNKIRNDIYSLERGIRKKEETLENSKNIDTINLDVVNSIFNEANYHFPEMVNTRLEQAEAFHIRVHKSRQNRLKEQLKSLINECIERKETLCMLEFKRDEILKDLDSKGALEEFNSIVEHIRTIEAKISKLQSYQIAIDETEKEKSKLESDKAKLNIEAIDYLESQKEYIKEIETQFRKLVFRFYDDHGGALRIHKNQGEAKYLFEIEPYIKKDSSQGVGEVKIFCYDMLLFELNKNLLGFMAHDSFLFGGVDHRQAKMIMKIALEKCQNDGLQYFVNLNKNEYEQLFENDLTEEVLSESNLKEELLSESDKKSLIDGTILKLFDDKPESTLFGEYFG